ncbi:DUF6559 family protein [Ferrimonas senticii]|uniref:DUF6559 family protein n=1 Tax=Ferrimonas senticii TaxID=394566 RepID=UPI000481EE11
MLQSFFKNRRIKKYARKLPQDLKAQYGWKNHYTKLEVDSAIKRKRLGSSSTATTTHCFAYAMYCTKEEFDRIHQELGETCNYGSMRSDISALLFNGASDFSFSSLLIESSSPSSSSISGFDGGGSDDGAGGGD